MALDAAARHPFDGMIVGAQPAAQVQMGGFGACRSSTVRMRTGVPPVMQPHTLFYSEHDQRARTYAPPLSRAGFVVARPASGAAGRQTERPLATAGMSSITAAEANRRAGVIASTAGRTLVVRDRPSQPFFQANLGRIAQSEPGLGDVSLAFANVAGTRRLVDRGHGGGQQAVEGVQ